MAYIKQAFIYEILKQYNRGEISFGRFCELINEEANNNTKIYNYGKLIRKNERQQR